MASARASLVAGRSAELEIADAKPSLVLIAGLPGSRQIDTRTRPLAPAAPANCCKPIDRIRKDLAGALTGPEIYTAEWNDRTYCECLRRAQELLLQGKPVVVDANFREDAKRQMFLEGAQRCGVPAILLLCRTDPEVARQRLANRLGDISDADWSVRERLAIFWEDLGPVSRRHAVELDANGDPDTLLRQAVQKLDLFSMGTLRGVDLTNW